jgi:hypothetical protein
VQVGRVALGEDLDVDRDGGLADALDAGVEAEQVAHRDRLLEDELVDGDGDDPALGDPGRKDGAGEVDLGHDPATEDVAVAVGVCRHRHDAYDELTIVRQRQGRDPGHRGESVLA